MPTTPTWLLPYPLASAPADVPTDVAALCNRLETVITQVNAVGIPKPAGAVAGETAVYDGANWVRSSVTRVGPASLGSGTRDGTKFLRDDGSWQGAAPAAGSISSAQIVDGTIIGTDMAAGAVGSREIADGSIVSADLAAGAALGNIAADSITATHIAPGAVGTSEVADASLVGGDLVAGTITTRELQDGGITAGDIAAAQITSAHIVDGTIIDADLAADTLTSRVIAPNAIGSSELADGSVDTAAIIDGSVTNPKILDGAVTSAKIADGTIVAADMAAGAAVGNIGVGVLTSSMIADGTIVTADLAAGAAAGNIADGSLTPAKIAGTAVITSDSRLTNTRVPTVGYDPTAASTVFPTTGLFNGYRFTLLMVSPGGGFGGYVACDCIYRADLDGTYPWHVCGGGHLITVCSGTINDSGYNYYGLANAIAVPRSGIWDGDAYCYSTTGGGGGCLARLAVGASIYSGMGFGNSGHNTYTSCWATIGAGGQVVVQGQTSVGNNVSYQGMVGARPIRLI